MFAWRATLAPRVINLDAGYVKMKSKQERKTKKMKTGKQNPAVGGHFHPTGKFRGLAYNKCQLNT